MASLVEEDEEEGAFSCLNGMLVLVHPIEECRLITMNVAIVRYEIVGAAAGATYPPPLKLAHRPKASMSHPLWPSCWCSLRDLSLTESCLCESIVDGI